MKFITENDLRAIYRAEPFTSYETKAGERLTPGARQFLIDCGVNMYGERPVGVVKKAASAAKPVNRPQKRLLRYRLEGLRLHFFEGVREMLQTEPVLAQELAALARQLALLVLYTQDKCQVADLYCQECSGLKAENFGQAEGDCVSVNEFSLQLENAQALLTLARLRNEAQVFAVELELMDIEESLQRTLVEKINQISNRLSQMICQAMGGKECQRKV